MALFGSAGLGSLFKKPNILGSNGFTGLGAGADIPGMGKAGFGFENAPELAKPVDPMSIAVAAPQKIKRSPFRSDSPLWKVLGGIGDVMTGNPMFTNQLLSQKEDERRSLMDQAKQQQEREEWLYRQQWERENRAPPQPTEFERLLDASGFSPEERQAKLRSYVEVRANPMMPVQGFDAQGNPTITMMPRNGGAQATPPSAPVGKLRPLGGPMLPASGGFR